MLQRASGIGDGSPRDPWRSADLDARSAVESKDLVASSAHPYPKEKQQIRDLASLE